MSEPRGHRAAADSGASLILILVLLLFVGLVVGAVLKLARTGLEASLYTADQGRLAVDVNSALDTAVNQVRQGTFRNRAGEACVLPEFTGPNTDYRIQVVCQGEAGTTAESFSGVTLPPAAVISKSNAGQDPQGVHKFEAGQLKIRGSVFSDSTVKAEGSGSGDAIVVQSPGVVNAWGVCEGPITADSTNCGSHARPPDFAYSVTETAPARQAVPDCPAEPGATVSFEPGFYDDAAALSDRMGRCPSSTFWFKPGKYYFDFRNGESPFRPGAPIWEINHQDVRVVGGTPVGWDPDAGASSQPTIPGACDAPNDLAANGGVEFVFGGRSQLRVTAGQLELCGAFDPAAASPPFAMRGQVSDAPGYVPPQPRPWWPNTFEPISELEVPDCKAFNNHPTDAQYFDNKDAQRTQNPAKEKACMRLGGYAQGQDPIPPGSILMGAALFVSHSEDKTPASIIARVRPNPTSGGTPLPDIPVVPIVGKNVPVGQETIPVTPGSPGWDSLAATLYNSGLSDASIDYIVEKSPTENPGKVRLDTLQLLLEYLPPISRGQGGTVVEYSEAGTHTAHGTVETGNGTSTGVDFVAPGTQTSVPSCTAAAPYPGAAACAMLKTDPADSGAGTRLYVHGIAYAPLAAFDVRLREVAAPVFDLGLVGRTLRLSIQSTAGYSGPHIALPGGGLGVHLHAYVCPPDSTCSGAPPGAPWDLVGGARATYQSQAGGRRSVVVNDWQLYF